MIHERKKCMYYLPYHNYNCYMLLCGMCTHAQYYVSCHCTCTCISDLAGTWKGEEHDHSHEHGHEHDADSEKLSSVSEEIQHIPGSRSV